MKGFYKKILMTLAILGTLSIMFIQTATSATITATLTDDISINSRSNWQNDDQLSIDSQKSLITYLKFSVSDIKSTDTILSATLRMYGYSNAKNNNLNLYISQENWNESTKFKWNEKPELIGNILNTQTITKAGKNNSGFIEWDLSNYFINDNFQNLADGYISFGIVSGNNKSAYLNSKESGQNIPTLTFEVQPAASAPEPSSMILGVLGIGSFLGLRKK